MSSPSIELRATVTLTRAEVAHLWHGGVLSLKIEGQGADADIELRCPEGQTEPGSRIRIKRVSAE
jgi:hypothetical protein